MAAAVVSATNNNLPRVPSLPENGDAKSKAEN
ncbi:putative transcription factor [Corchorus olitorius]|uniref:Transcription factor n=1 Tax=Corchorus olitorius TaxID=93759 RepID=A0A1R3GJE1_9ROSI|nr:putative transcription factor [Corchorus olitorius]